MIETLLFVRLGDGEVCRNVIWKLQKCYDGAYTGCYTNLINVSITIQTARCTVRTRSMVFARAFSVSLHHVSHHSHSWGSDLMPTWCIMLLGRSWPHVITPQATHYHTLKPHVITLSSHTANTPLHPKANIITPQGTYHYTLKPHTTTPQGTHHYTPRHTLLHSQGTHHYTPSHIPLHPKAQKLGGTFLWPTV